MNSLQRGAVIHVGVFAGIKPGGNEMNSLPLFQITPKEGKALNIASFIPASPSEPVVAYIAARDLVSALMIAGEVNVKRIEQIGQVLIDLES